MSTPTDAEVEALRVTLNAKRDALFVRVLNSFSQKTEIPLPPPPLTKDMAQAACDAAYATYVALDEDARAAFSTYLEACEVRDNLNRKG
jgi:hypothetical protein